MIDWLYGLQHFGIKLGLDNIKALLASLDHPERSQPAIVVAGTNGKGSVAAMLHAMLCAHGWRAGLFTSPHLVRPNERIRIGERDVSSSTLDGALARVKSTIERGLTDGQLEHHPSFFEVITAAALSSFREASAEVAVLEVGLGGALDATNAVDADVAVIVSIDLDHVKTLGSTLESIAAEKAGILRPHRPVISGVSQQRARSVIEEIGRERGSELIDARLAVELTSEHEGALELRTERGRYADVRLGLLGRHQIDNARIALAAFERFLADRGRISAIDPEAVRRGLAGVRWPGRLQWVRSPAGGPDLLLDGAHNPAGMRTLTRYLATLRAPASVAVFGAMQGKLLEPMLDDLSKHVHTIVVTRPDVDRAWDPEALAAECSSRFARVQVEREPSAALARAAALASDESFVLVTGSLYLVGAVLAHLEGASAPGPVAM